MLRIKFTGPVDLIPVPLESILDNMAMTWVEYLKSANVDIVNPNFFVIEVMRETSRSTLAPILTTDLYSSVGETLEQYHSHRIHHVSLVRILEEKRGDKMKVEKIEGEVMPEQEPEDEWEEVDVKVKSEQESNEWEDMDEEEEVEGEALKSEGINKWGAVSPELLVEVKREIRKMKARGEWSEMIYQSPMMYFFLGEFFNE